MIQTNTSPFDTLRYANRLKKVGVPNEQAEELAELQAETINNNLATKTDIELIRKDIEQLRKDTTSDIEQLRKDTVISIANAKDILGERIESIEKRTKLIIWIITILGIINTLPAAIQLIKNVI